MSEKIQIVHHLRKPSHDSGGGYGVRITRFLHVDDQSEFRLSFPNRPHEVQRLFHTILIKTEEMVYSGLQSGFLSLVIIHAEFLVLEVAPPPP